MTGWWVFVFSSCGWQTPVLAVVAPEALAVDTGQPPDDTGTEPTAPPQPEPTVPSPEP